MGRYGTRQATKAAKARLSGTIPSNSPKNKKIAFGKDDDDLESKIDEGENVVNTADAGIGDSVYEDFGGKVDGNDEDDDDAVEEVAGSAARESIQRQRDEERKVVKDATSKKKRRKKDDAVGDQLESKKDKEYQSDDENEDEEEEKEEEEEENEFTDDFFKMVDSERAVQLQNAKKERKHTKMLQQKVLGKHTTFVVEGDYEMVGASHNVEQNIEVVALGGSGEEESSTHVHSERQLIISATLGSAPSKAAVTFARGSMTCGTTKERSSESRKRKSKDEETWKRSRKLNRMGIGSRPGQAATLFVCKKK
jgi:hypothetical protein